MEIIDHANTVLRIFDIEPKPLDKVLSAYLKDHREMNSKMRRSLTDLAFGIMRWKRRLDGFLSLSGVKKIGWKERAICYLSWRRPHDIDLVTLDREASKIGLVKFLDEISQKHFPGGMAGYLSFPDFLYREIEAVFGDEAPKVAMRLNEPILPMLRVNTLKASREEAISSLNEDHIECFPTRYSPYGLRLSGRINLNEVKTYRDGVVELQDEASQLATMIASPKPGCRILDLCAGAGGKSLMLSMLMNDGGSIFATDLNKAKLKELKRRMNRAGASCISVLNLKGLRASEKMKGSFDVVLVDAPCSGTGTLRRSPDLKWRLSENSVSRRRDVQSDLLIEASEYVRSGGKIVYLTCSLLPEENEEIILEFIKDGGVEICDPRSVFDDHEIDANSLVSNDHFFRTHPLTEDWDGFFGASLICK